MSHLSAPPPGTATYEVIYMTGWAPHPSQQKAARRGSATVSFEELVEDLGAEGGAEGGGGSTSNPPSVTP